ncbi:hypothetical protein PV11_05474 [Exophiala sideris]|uniref:Transcription factor TFIIIC triple barrel domain-containing protein n=1 Tax=Exophiala sideris TaxID=1016849 RepID=A0A0D1X6P5_9EURO|nr:hypothetical protein PV11_05474 [Exophiala sideris]
MQEQSLAPSLDEAYEYEYDETETETFLVDLDLSSLQSNLKTHVPGAPKPGTPGRRRRRGDAVAQTPEPTGTPDDHSPSATEAQGTPARDAEESGPGALPFMTKVQILGLDTTNPVVSYNDRVYSCMWTDMIGSNMFLAQPGLIESGEILHSADDFDLIGTSRIKLVGERTNLIKKNPPAQETNTSEEDEQGQSVEPREASDGRSFGDIRTPNAKTNAQIKRQASFLEKLMDLKRRRGEGGIVPASVDEILVSNGATELHNTRHSEVEELHRAADEGDAEALAGLQDIYSHQGEAAEQLQEIAQTPEGEIG